MGAKTDLVTWNPCKEHIFASSHAKELKVWDVRKVGGGEGTAVMNVNLGNVGSVGLSRM